MSLKGKKRSLLESKVVIDALLDESGTGEYPCLHAICRNKRGQQIPQSHNHHPSPQEKQQNVTRTSYPTMFPSATEITTFRAQFTKVSISNYINGKRTPSDSHMTILNPSTQETIGTLPLSSAQEVDAAVVAATNAFPQWSALSAQSRAEYLNKIADRISDRLVEFAIAESMDQGKPLNLSLTIDIPRAVHNFRTFASAILHQTSTSISNPSYHTFVLHEPVGVCALITPWNLPLYLLTWKLAPCIAFGCTAVIKPSEFTSLTAHLLVNVLEEVGLPAGVVNMVFGDGKTGSSMIHHPHVKAISFTGGTVTGSKIYQAAAGVIPNASHTNAMKKVSLELGGKNASVVFADCDYETAVSTSVRSSFTNQGEICLCMSRIYAHSSIYEKFVADFVSQVRQITVGDGLCQDTRMGSLVSEQHMNKVLSYIEIAKKQGGVVQTGGSRLVQRIQGRCIDGNSKVFGQGEFDFSKGFYVEPTVITNVTNTCTIQQEEVFGPVVTITPFDDVEKVIQQINGVEYGLASCVWSRNLDTVNHMVRKIEAGTVWVNCWMVRDLNMPFGGVKSSGMGREGVHDSFEFFCEKKTVCVKL
jgi:aminomuconate-semialdehyde/2-hydroxymuconate-6-semialdehyde dehydrogenase